VGLVGVVVLVVGFGLGLGLLLLWLLVVGLVLGWGYFMGQPVTKEHCIQVLKTGYQRQRILAAQYLCLLEPGTPLFNTAAPAWRQQRLLAAM
jgi:hypothetical protein